MCKPACLQNCAAVLQIFALFLVHAYSTRVWKREASDSTSLSAAAVEHGFQSPEGHSKLIMDGPWILLWPCFLLWPFFEGVVGFGFIHNAVGDAILLAIPFLVLLSWPLCSSNQISHCLGRHPQHSFFAMHLRHLYQFCTCTACGFNG